MILTSTQAGIEGYEIRAYKGIAQGETWNELLCHAKELGANAVINTCFDDALDVETLFHGSAVVVRRRRSPGQLLRKPERHKGPKRSWSDG